MKYSDRLVERIVKLIEADVYTVSEICDVAGIDRKTFYEWKNGKPDFRKAVEGAACRCDESLVKTARISLKQRLEGYTVTEERITYEPSRHDPSLKVEKSHMVKHKQYPPDLRAIQWVLDRNDRKNADDQRLLSAKLEIRTPDTGVTGMLKASLHKMGVTQEDVSIVHGGGEELSLPEKEEKEKCEIPQTAEVVVASAAGMNSYRTVLPPGYLY
jgi:transposase-like protein